MLTCLFSADHPVSRPTDHKHFMWVAQCQFKLRPSCLAVTSTMLWLESQAPIPAPWLKSLRQTTSTVFIYIERGRKNIILWDFKQSISDMSVFQKTQTHYYLFLL